MNEVQARIVEIVHSMLEHTDRSGLEVTLEIPLHGEDGLQLDSLETAELSAILEDEYGSDPFGAGLLPETIAEIAAFYADADEAAATA
jgi:acyl carrier protein